MEKVPTARQGKQTAQTLQTHFLLLPNHTHTHTRALQYKARVGTLAGQKRRTTARPGEPQHGTPQQDSAPVLAPRPGPGSARVSIRLRPPQINVRFYQTEKNSNPALD